MSHESSIGKSDHCTITLSPRHQQYKFNGIRECTVHDYRVFNTNKLKRNASNVDCQSITTIEDPTQLLSTPYKCVKSKEKRYTHVERQTLDDTADKMLINENWKAF